MRLSEAERMKILSTVRAVDAECRLFLYGSRVDPTLTGGDIDLLILSEKLGFSEKISLLVEIKKQLGDQKIDLLVKTAKDARDDAFVQSIWSSMIELK